MLFDVSFSEWWFYYDCYCFNWYVFYIFCPFRSLDYPGVGPEHSFLKDLGRAEYFSVTDDEAIEGNAYKLREYAYASRIVHVLESVVVCCSSI